MALIQDGAGVAAQVLLAGALKNKEKTETNPNAKTNPKNNRGNDEDTKQNNNHATLQETTATDAAASIQSTTTSKSRYHEARSLVTYMLRFSVLQGMVATAVLLLAAPFIPGCFVPGNGAGSEVVRAQLIRLLPHVALQQLLVGPTLVAEALAAGGGRFGLLALGTGGATLVAFWQLQQATTVASIWSRGIVSLFVGRLLTALVGTALVLRECKREAEEEAAILA
mmetsp:Transcript_14881/g.30449  ORF Transcript_14881/g.30449 Transcript_14881/m.30449 type:complete len:225 (-) Transcript_14881:267-941(-)